MPGRARSAAAGARDRRLARRFPFVVVALALAGAGCGGGGSSAPLPADFSIALRRSLCFGTCPVYDVAADASGAVTFHGQRFVRAHGTQHGNVSRQALRRLHAQIERIGFFALEDEFRYWGERCPQLATDAATVTIAVTRAGVTHQLDHYLGCLGDPVVEDLEALEVAIDDALGSAEWVFCAAHDSYFLTSCPDQ